MTIVSASAKFLDLFLWKGWCEYFKAVKTSNTNFWESHNIRFSVTILSSEAKKLQNKELEIFFVMFLFYWQGKAVGSIKNWWFYIVWNFSFHNDFSLSCARTSKVQWAHTKDQAEVKTEVAGISKVLQKTLGSQGQIQPLFKFIDYSIFG